MVKKLVAAAAAGTAVFLVIMTDLFLFSMLMAAKAQAWEQAATGLSGLQAAGISLALAVRATWWLVTPFVFLMSVGGSLWVAAVKMGGAAAQAADGHEGGRRSR